MFEDGIEGLLETDPNKALCIKCCELKTWPEMSLDKDVKSGYTNVCKKCVSLRVAKYRPVHYARRKITGRRGEYLKYQITYSFNNARNRARRKKLEFNIDLEDLFILYDGKCSITGIKFQLYNKKLSTYSPSLDRIDNTKGYVKGNLRYILYGINAMKSDMSDKDLYKICLMVTANKKKLWLD